ncbi:MAG: signal peptidase I [Dietzia sp.]
MHTTHAEHPLGGGHRESGEPEPPADERTTIGWWLRTVGGWLLLLVAAAVLLLLIVIPRASGAQAYTVLTGSMEPTISPGALVVVRHTPLDELRAGDVITFQPHSGDPTVVTHRITGIYYDMSGRPLVHTQGDANNTPDDWALVPEQVRGVLWYTVPQLGRVNLLLTGDTRALGITVVAGGLIIYSVAMFGSGLRDRSSRKKAARVGRGDCARYPSGREGDPDAAP